MCSTRNAVSTVGARVQRLREELDLSRHELGRPEFSAGYVRAVEDDAHQPSAPALALLADRLAVAPGVLHAAIPAPAGGMDLHALAEDLIYQFKYVDRLVRTQPGEALQQLDGLEQAYGAYLPLVGAHLHYLRHYLRATAYLAQGNPARARRTLEEALAWPDAGAVQEGERVRHALGVALYRQGLPALALAHHARCLLAINTHVVKDLDLRLAITCDLAADYWTLGAPAQAVGLYLEARDLLRDVNNPAREAEVHAGLSRAYQALGDLEPARLHATHALSIHEGTGNEAGIAGLRVTLAAVALAQGVLEEADTQLARALDLFHQTGADADNQLGLCLVYTHYAALALQRGELERAAEHAYQALHLAGGICPPAVGAAEGVPAGPPSGIYARACAMTGRIEELRGHQELADALFRQALAEPAPAAQDATARELQLMYADLLAARGAHQQAGVYYRAALQRAY